MISYMINVFNMVMSKEQGVELLKLYFDCHSPITVIHNMQGKYPIQGQLHKKADTASCKGI